MARAKAKPQLSPNGKKPLTVGVAVAILAAGKGTRLKSKHPKVLHRVGGKPMLAHVVAAAAQVVRPQDIYAIIGHEAQRVREALGETGINFVLQEEQRGTGHAIMVARQALANYEHVIVLSGDVPLISSKTIERLRDFHVAKKAAMSVLSAEMADPHGYGRVVRKRPHSDELQTIVEEKALTPAQQHLCEINSGIYAFRIRPLFEHIGNLGTDNVHREYYLTDMASILSKAGERVYLTEALQPSEVRGGNTRHELTKIDREMRLRKCAQLVEEGVTVYFPETCLIDADVQVGADSVVEPFVQLLGKTKIGCDSRVRSYTVIENSEIAEEVEIRPGCVIENSRIARGAVIGPYSHLRPESDIGERAHIGNFVETKKMRFGHGSKANHLTYLGDAIIGENVNVGAGTITCNYDGVRKHQTLIEDGAFIGSDSTLVAPLRIGKNAYVAAGSSITQDVPEDALGIARGRQVNKEGWAKQRRQRPVAAAIKK